MQYWEKVPKSNTVKRFYRFLCPVMGKGCICSQVQYWKKVLGSTVQYWEKVPSVPQFITGKGSRFQSPKLGKGSIGFPVKYLEKVLDSPVQYCEKVLGSSNQYWENVL